MKADDYVDRFQREEDVQKAVYDLLVGLLEDVVQTCKDRKCKTFAAEAAVVKEVEAKYRAIVRRLPNVLNPDGFSNYLKSNGLDVGGFGVMLTGSRGAAMKRIANKIGIGG